MSVLSCAGNTNYKFHFPFPNMEGTPCQNSVMRFFFFFFSLMSSSEANEIQLLIFETPCIPHHVKSSDIGIVTTLRIVHSDHGICFDRMVNFLLSVKSTILDNIPVRKAGLIFLAWGISNGPQKEMIFTLEEDGKERHGNMVCWQIPQPVNKKLTTVCLSIK